MRERKIDYVKGFTIILMIFGHCIQFGSGIVYEESQAFFSNKLFQLIYSFHMPLFMLISGFYFSCSVKKYSNTCVVLRKSCQLLLPIFSWSFLRILLVAMRHGSEYKLLEYLKWWISDGFQNFWFVWAVFILSIGVVLIRVMFQDNVNAYIILMIVLLLVPDGNFGQYKFMYPYFVCGYLLSKKDVSLEDLPFINSRKCVVTYLGIFCAGFLFFRETILTDMHYCLLSSKTFWWQFLQIIYKYGIGAVGSLLVLSIVCTFYKEHRVNDFVCILGQETLGIYVIQVFINHIILREITSGLSPNIGINILEAVIVLFMCHIAIWIVDRTYLTRFLFLGKFTRGKIELKW